MSISSRHAASFILGAVINFGNVTGGLSHKKIRDTSVLAPFAPWIPAYSQGCVTLWRATRRCRRRSRFRKIPWIFDTRCRRRKLRKKKREIGRKDEEQTRRLLTLNGRHWIPLKKSTGCRLLVYSFIFQTWEGIHVARISRVCVTPRRQTLENFSAGYRSISQKWTLRNIYFASRKSIVRYFSFGCVRLENFMGRNTAELSGRAINDRHSAVIPFVSHVLMHLFITSWRAFRVKKKGIYFSNWNVLLKHLLYFSDAINCIP